MYKSVYLNRVGSDDFRNIITDCDIIVHDARKHKIEDMEVVFTVRKSQFACANFDGGHEARYIGRIRFQKTLAFGKKVIR